MKKLTILLSLLFSVSSFAQAEKKSEAPVKDHLQNHFKMYGFIRNYFVYDSRESVSGTADLFYYLPKDVSLVNKDTDYEMDKNAASSFRFLALTSRLGVDVSGYHIGNMHFGAKIEGDFYSGLSSVDDTKNPGVKTWFPANTKIMGTATARLRQAYATITWKDLPMCNDQKASVGLKMGQAWHPMGADMPHVFSLETGAPFGPFSRTPQVTVDANFGQNWVVSASALWQMQYNSSGPIESSAMYMKYGKTPELYAAVAYKSKGFLFRAGADVLSIKPRVLGTKTLDDGAVNRFRVSDRHTSVLYYLYTQYTEGKFALKAKSTFGEGGEHLNLMSGYAKVGENSDGSWEYAALRSSSSWLSMSYGKTWQGVLFLGYVKTLGFAKELSAGSIAKSDVYFCSNGAPNINQIYRINPQLIYNIGKMNVGFEYQWTAVQYGDYTNGKLNGFGKAVENLHWVGNHRLNMMVKYNF